MEKFSKAVKEGVYASQGGYCANDVCMNKAVHAHHIVPNTKLNRKLWPVFMQSPFNCVYLCYDCHMNKALPDKPNNMLLNVYESFLQEEL